MNTQRPTLYVCHGDEQSPRFHPTHSKEILRWFEEQRAG
jgi:hypothetical protein